MSTCNKKGFQCFEKQSKIFGEVPVIDIVQIQLHPLFKETSCLSGTICQEHVIPGLTDSLLNCQRSYCFTSSSRGGRGPISDISPLTTLNSWGNSSRPVLRRNFPTLVILGSSLILKTGPSASFIDPADFSAESSASTTMVLNLNNLNFRPRKPIRLLSERIPDLWSRF